MPDAKAIHDPTRLKTLYQDEEVAEDYIDTRFRRPLGQHLHLRQVAFLQRSIDAVKPRFILELAPGPARVTTELKAFEQGTALDASPAMLTRARERLVACGRADRWTLCRGDAFSLPIGNESVDFAYSLRFIRHFKTENRHALYSEIRRVMRPGALLCFDAVDAKVAIPYRRRRGFENYPIYDVMYEDLSQLEEEVSENGFRLANSTAISRMVEVQEILTRFDRVGLGRPARMLISAIDSLVPFPPAEWMVACQKV